MARIDQLNNSTPVAPAVGDRIPVARSASGTWTDYPVPAESISATGCQTGIAAAGTTQSTATQLTGFTAVVTSGAAGAGVILPTPSAPTFATVLIKSTQPIYVYVPVGHTLDSSGTGNEIAGQSAVILLYVGGTQWYTIHSGT